MIRARGLHKTSFFKLGKLELKIFGELFSNLSTLIIEEKFKGLKKPAKIIIMGLEEYRDFLFSAAFYKSRKMVAHLAVFPLSVLERKLSAAFLF